MNGDDGYADAGGGGSVWYEFQVSETDTPPAVGPAPGGRGHRPRKNTRAGYVVQRGKDTYAEHSAGDRVGGSPVGLPAADPLIAFQGTGYLELIVDDATQIERIEVGPGNSLRLFVKVAPPAVIPGPRQASLRWGLRRIAVAPAPLPPPGPPDSPNPVVGPALAWADIRDCLVENGAVDIAVEGPAASADFVRKTGAVTGRGA